MNWYDLLKEALGDKANEMLASMQSTTMELFKKMWWDEIKRVAVEVKAAYEKTKSVADQELTNLANKVTWEKNVSKKIESTNSTTKESEVIMAPASTESWVQQPEIIPNRKLVVFDESLAVVTSDAFKDFRIKNGIDGSKLSAEQQANIDAFDKVQASLKTMLDNANTRWMSEKFINKASAVMTLDFFKNLKTGAWADFSLVSKKPITTLNSTINGVATDVQKSMSSFTDQFEKSGFKDMASTATFFMSAINNASAITKKWNNFFAWIGDGDMTGWSLENSQMSSIYTLYQSCENGYPDDKTVDGLKTTWDDSVWISDQMKSINIPAQALKMINENTKQIIDTLINPENQKSLQKFVATSESVIDTVVAQLGTFGIGMEQIESLLAWFGKFFENNAWIWSALWVDLTSITSMCLGKLSPKEEKTLTIFLNHYQKLDGTWVHEWEQYITDDPESKKQWIIRTINLSAIKTWLTTMTPSASLVSNFAGEDVVKRATYFDKDESWALTVLKSWSTISDADKWVVGDYYLKDEAIIKNLIKDVTWAEWDDMRVVGRAATWYMKWARGDKFYDTYMSKHVNDKKEVKDINKEELANNDQSSSPELQQYSQLIISEAPNNIKKKFGLETICFGRDSTIIDQTITKIGQMKGWNDTQMSNFPLWIAAIYSRETNLNLTIANADPHQDGKTQTAWWLPQFSLVGDPKLEAQRHFTNFTKSPYGQWIDFGSLTDLDDPRWQTIAYFWYLLERKTWWELFGALAQLPLVKDHQLAKKMVVNEIQWAKFIEWKKEKAYTFLQEDTIWEYLKQAPVFASKKENTNSIWNV